MRTAWVVVILLLATGARAERVAPPPSPAKKLTCAAVAKREAAVKLREDDVARREAALAKKNEAKRQETERLKHEREKLNRDLK
ncbi:MAG TPA: hypothetical protein VL326_04215 [Kofleriaceae bacterium]|jgi:hypothetical protein|nr:hypothetical protein [Kofleriaceae bacterium]